MRFWVYLFLAAWLPVIAVAQTGAITGKVTSADLQMPLAGASVFLTNSTYGTSTANDGTFTLANVKPGQYLLVVTYVGYDNFQQTVLVGNSPIKLNVDLHLKSYGLGEVEITAHKFNKENFDMFTKYFLGTSANAKQCKILNPNVIDLSYSKFDKVLKGHSDEFIIIENRALGYRLKYLLNSFKLDGINEILSFGGQPLYEDLPGSKSQLEKWHKKREEAYYGSSQHFYRSLKNNELQQQGFIMYHLARTPNRNRPAQFVIVKKMDQFIALRNRDSLFYWQNLYKLRRYIDDLDRTPLNQTDVLKLTDNPEVFGITFRDCLYVVYTKKHDEEQDNDLYRPLDMENFMVTIVTLYKDFALFDMNGVVISDRATLYEGSWARNKIPELLPVDYEPDDKRNAKVMQ